MFTRTLSVERSLVAGIRLPELGRPSGDRAAPTPVLTDFPSRIGAWAGRAAPAFSSEVLASLALDDHLNRFYVSAERFAHLYIGYYRSQREGASIHSPLNCLPGAGWLPLSNGRLDISIAPSSVGHTPRSITVNRYVIKKGLDNNWSSIGIKATAASSPTSIGARRIWFSTRFVSVGPMRPSCASSRHTATPILPEVTAEQTAVEFVKAMFPTLTASCRCKAFMR